MKDSKRLNGKRKLIIFGITIVMFLLTILFAMTSSNYDGGIIKLFDKQKDTVDFIITIRDSMDSSKLISNAKFVIREMTIENDAYVFSPPYNADGNVLGTPEIINGETVYTFESNENGQIITQLRNGIYKLEQISTIEGYDTLENAIHFYFGVGEGLGALVELDANEPYLTSHTDGVTITTEHCVEGRPDGSALYYNVGYLDYIELVDGKDVVVWEKESNTVYSMIADEEGFDVLTDTSIIRYDNAGNATTLTSVLSGAERFVKDSNGNFVVAGTFNKSITIDANNTVSGNKISISSNNSDDIYIAVITPEGLVESLYGIPTAYDENLSDMDILDNGDYVVSYIADGGYSYEIMIIDAESQSYKNSVYVNTTGRSTALVNDVIAGPNGGIYYSGAFKGTLYFDTYETVSGEEIYVESYGDVDGVVIKYNTDLLVEWVTVIGGPGTDHFYKADLTADGGLLLAGDSDTGSFKIAGSLTQSGISISTSPQWSNAGTWRGIAFKVNDDGEPVWGKELGYTSDEGMYAVTAFTNNSFAICGLETSDIRESAFIRVKEDILMEEIVALESLTIENIPITYDVTTEVVNNIGGTISGYDTDVYEIVAWGTNSKETIEVSSETGYRIKSITIQKTDDDGKVQEEVITFNSTTTEYTLDKFIDVKEHIHIAVEFEEMKAMVQVNYYLEGTTTRILSKDGTELGPEEYQGLTGLAYTVTPNSNIAEYYELVEVPANASGIYTDSLIEVNYYYRLKKYNYTVEYYFGGVIDDTLTYIGTDVYGTEITTYTDKVKEGYKLDRVETLPMVVGVNENVLKVYYEIDENQTKELSYTINYYKGWMLANSEVVTQTVHVLEEDILNVDKSKINLVDKFTGYYFSYSEPDIIPETIENGGKISVYYAIRTDLNYTVNYLEKDTNKVLANQKSVGFQTFGITATEKAIDIPGYNVDGSSEKTITIGITGNEINFYYTKRNDLSYTVKYLEQGTNKELSTEKVVNNQTFGESITETAIEIEGYNKVNTEETIVVEVTGNEIIFYYTKRNNLSYTINYYEQGTNIKLLESDIVENLTFGDVVTENAIDIEGYNKLDPTTQTITIKVTGNEINFYYTKRNDLSYRVEYYYNNVIDNEETEIVDNQVFGTVISNYTDKVKNGYKLDRVETVPMTVGVNENVVKVYYVTDDTQTKELSYTVEYYKDGVKVNSDTEVETKTVQILEPDIMTVNKATINIVDKYYGYKIVDGTVIPDTVNSGDVIRINYVLDDSQTKELSYTVEYYKSDILVDADTQIKTQIVQVLEEDILTVDKTDINITDKYYGYTLDSKTVIPDIVNNGDIIKVYYKVDEKKKKTIKYRIEYYKEGTEQVEVENKSVLVQVLEPDEIVIDKAAILDNSKYTGFSLSTTEQDLPNTVVNDDVIKVYYVKNYYNYTVNYYYDGVLDSTKTDILSAKYGENIETYEDKVIDGYKFQGTGPSPLIITIDENINVFEVFYIKDEFEYTVEYYFDGIKDDNETVTSLALFDSVVNTYTDKGRIGYKLEKVENNPLTITSNPTNNVMRVYYVIDTANTKELSYTVEYYKDGVKVDFDTEVEKVAVQVLESDIMTVNKAAINIVDKYYGYKVIDGTVIPDTVTSGEVIRIDYVIDPSQTKELSYTVEYYKDGVKVDSDTEVEKTTVQVLESDNITVNKDNINITDKYEGYLFEGTDPENVPDKVVNGTIIKVNYRIRTDLSYTINYYEQGTNIKLLESDIVENLTFGDVVTENAIDIEGYNKPDPTTQTITIKVTGNEINFYYTKRNDLSYRVEYYYNNVIDNEQTEIVDNQVFGTVISNYTDKVKNGYKLDRVETLPMTVGVNENVVKVYYVTDDTQTKELSYTVEYYKDGVKVNSDTEVEKTTVQVLESDIIEVNKDKINLTDKYVGYRLEKTEPEMIPESVTSGDVIKVYYVIDDGNTKELSYTVEYYKDGVLADTEVEKVTVQVLESDIMTVNKATINIVDKYYGYKVVDGTVIPDTVTSGEVIRIDYVIDPSQTKELSYTVEYYKDGVKVDFDTEVEKVAVQVLESDIMTVNKAAINIVDKYYGYKVVDGTVIPDTVTSGEVIRIDYEIDPSQTKELSYTVEYYKDGVKVDSDTEVEKVAVQVLESDNITVNKDNINVTDKYEGYLFEGTEPENIPDTVVNGTIIRVNYIIRSDLSYVVNYLEQGTNNKLAEEKIVENKIYEEVITERAIDIEGYNKVNAEETIEIKVTGNEINFYYTKRNDLSYRVEYYYNNVIDSEETEIVDNQVYGTVINNYTDKVKNGYKLDKVETLPMTVGINENVVKVYYVTDESQTKELSYTVEYYKDGTLADTEEEKTTVQVLEPNTMVVNKDRINVTDKYVGYRLEKTEPEIIPDSVTSGDVIKVYYVIDDGNTKTLSYTVEYYKDGVLADTEVETKTVQILEPDTMTVDKDSINVIDKYEGYVFKGTEPENIPDTVVNGAIIKVNYGIRNDLTYTINYYEKETNVKILESDIIENLTFGETVIENAIDIEGYNKLDPTTQTITIKVNGNEINFYYTKRTDLSYTVRYLEQGTENVLSSEKVVNNQTFGESITETAIDIEGYNKVNDTETIVVKVSGNEINFYYIKKNDLSYRVEYYYNNVIDNEQTEIVNNQVFGTVIDEYTDKVKDGYKLDRVETLPMTVGVNENVIKVYYITDDAQTKELSYTVEYYKEGVLVDTEIEKITVQLLAPDTITVNKDKINVTDKYEGYVFESTTPTNIPNTVVNETVIKVNYIRRSDLSYVVNYLEQGTNVKLKDSKTVNNKTFGESITENAIEIEGYNKVNATEAITIKVTGNEINFYYTKRNDLSYTVNYYENGTTNSLLTSKVVTNQLFGSNVREFAEEIEGYNKVDPTEKNITIGIKDNVIDFYYTKRNDLEYVVKYLEQGTEKVLSEEKIVNNQTFMDDITESAIDIEGYNKVNTEETIVVKVTGNEIVFYYTARTDLSYTVRYLEEGTNQELSVEKVVENQTFGESITETAIDIEGYNKVNDFETIVVKVTGNEIVFYYTKMDGLSYTVNYYEENTTNKLANSKVVDGKIYGDTVTETAIEIEGYNKVNNTETIIIDVTGNEINFYYTKRTDLSYTVKYLEQGTNQELSIEKVVENQTFGESITENAIDIEGYDKVNTEETIVIKVTGNEITFYYTKMNGLSYTVNYYEENTTNKLTNSKVVDGKVFSDIVTETAIEIEGYNKVNTEETIEIKVTGNEINFYYTKRTDLSYIVKYLEKGTDKELAITKTVNNKVFEEIVSETAIEIEGYNKVNETETIVVKVSGNEIIFYYTKRTDLSYIVNYIEQDTNVELKDSKLVNNQTFEDVVIEVAEEIEGYNKVNTEENITIKVTGNEINFYYTKRTDLSYTVKYLEQGTNINIAEDKTVTGQTFKSEIVESAIEVEGYNKVNTEESIIVEVSGNEIIFYYTKRKDLSYTVKYLEQGTNINVAEDKTVTGQIFKSEIVESAIEVDGYNKVNTDETIIVEVSGNEIIFYYTKRTDIKYTVEYYYNDVLDSSKTEEYVGTYLEEISNYVSKVENGYKLGTEINFPLIITTDESTNVIKINYVTDDAQTKELSYIVEYYKDGVKVDSDTQVETETVQLLAPDVLTVIKDNINITNKYVGYRLESTDPVVIPDTVANGEIIKVYYVKDNFDYIVEYYYENIIDPSKSVVTEATYQDVIDTYIDKIIPGYELDKVEGMPLTITEDESTNVIKVYYKKARFEYKVEYYYDDVLKEDYTETKEAIFEDRVETYTPKEDYGYKFDKVFNIPMRVTENVEDNVIKVYYVRKDSTVSVQFVDKVSGKEISEEVIKKGKVFDIFDITNDVKEIPGYTLIENPSKLTGTFEEENQNFIYYYAKTSNVVVKYLENETNVELLPEENIVGYESKEYRTTRKDIPNYTFVKDTENTSGVMTDSTITVIYYYAQNTRVIVNHIDYMTGAILDTVVQNGKVGDEYESAAKDITNYVLVESPVRETVTMTKDEIVLEYYYAHVSAGVIEKHIDLRTGAVLDNEEYVGNEGDSYITTSKTIQGYDLVTDMLPENASGTMTIDVIEVKYYYLRKTIVEVEYRDVVTGDLIPNNDGSDSTEIIDGHQGDRYTTIEKTFEGYDIESEKYPNNSTGIMDVVTDEDGEISIITKVVYYYRYKTKVVENHIDIVTGDIIEVVEYAGHEEDLYQTNSKTFELFDLLEDKKPVNDIGVMTKDVITVNYYYIQKTKVIVNYYDLATGKILKEIDETTKAEIDSTVIIEGHEGDEYEVKEKVFAGYDIVENMIPSNTKGVMTKGDITINYYYLYKTSVKVLYIEKANGNNITEYTLISGHEGDEFTISPKEITKYKLIESPKEEKGKMTKEPKVFVYYYVRVSDGVKEQHIDLMTGNVLEEIIHQGNVGDKYDVQAKAIDGYDLVWEKLPTNSKGTMEDGLTTVQYYHVKKADTSGSTGGNGGAVSTPATGDSIVNGLLIVAYTVLGVNVITLIKKKRNVKK